MSKYMVVLVRDLSEYANVEVEADSFDEAEEKAEALAADDGHEPPLKWVAGEDREGVYACDSWEAK